MEINFLSGLRGRGISVFGQTRGPLWVVFSIYNYFLYISKDESLIRLQENPWRDKFTRKLLLYFVEEFIFAVSITSVLKIK